MKCFLDMLIIAKDSTEDEIIKIGEIINDAQQIDTKTIPANRNISKFDLKIIHQHIENNKFDFNKFYAFNTSEFFEKEKS